MLSFDPSGKKASGSYVGIRGFFRNTSQTEKSSWKLAYHRQTEKRQNACPNGHPSLYWPWCWFMFVLCTIEAFTLGILLSLCTSMAPKIRQWEWMVRSLVTFFSLAVKNQNFSWIFCVCNGFEKTPMFSPQIEKDHAIEKVPSIHHLFQILAE